MNELAVKLDMAEVEEKQETESSLGEFWYFFKQNKGAVAGLVVILLTIVVAIFAPWIAPYSPTADLFSDALRVPAIWAEGGSSRFLLGTDDVGRDLFSRLVYGARVSLGIGFLVVLVSMSIGLMLGLVSGYFGGRTDRIIMRGVDILMSLPSILLAIVVVSILGPSLFNTIVAVAVVAIPGFIRIVRGSVLSEKVKPYVTASKTFGASHFRQMFVNILPNCMAPLIVQATLGFSDAILNAAALGFLGLGAQPPTAEWGTMLADSRQFIESSPNLVILPGVCILVVVLAFNLFGDGLRDAFDPRLRK